MGQNVIAIIPARGGSKGVPKKNIKLLGGLPLIAYSIRTALKVPGVVRALVSTDSEEIAAIAKEYGAFVPFLRPEAYSGDHATDFDVMKHALDWLQTNEGAVPDLIIHLRPTTPLRDPVLVTDALNAFMENREATALRSAHEMSESAYKSFEVDSGYFKTVGDKSFELDAANAARQKFPKTYSANGYVDILSSRYILETGKLHGNKVMAYLTPTATELDTIEDFHHLEYLIAGPERALYQNFYS